VSSVGLDIPESVAGVCESVFGDRLPIAERYASLLVNEGIERGLLGPREADRIWDRHIVNSLCVSPLIGPNRRVADIGSGAGLPGVVLGIARPDLRVDLVEPMARRCEFLSMCVEELGLSRVRVVRARGEEYDGKPQVLTCRAVSSVLGLIPVVSPFLKYAEMLAIKGERAEAEIEKARVELVACRIQAEILRPRVSGEIVGTVVRMTSR